MAIEDAAAPGIIFSDKYGFTNDIEVGVVLYQKFRKERATRVQQSSARAAENLDKRIRFSSSTPHDASLAAAEGKLTGGWCSLTPHGGKILMIYSFQLMR